MNYVISDIHGNYDKYKEMLDKIRFSDEDTLYVLGDCTDRGKKGIDIWLDLMNRSNVTMIMGNHDDMALKTMRAWRHPELFDGEVQEGTELWMYNGGRSTLEAFINQPESMQDKIIRFVSSFSTFKQIEVNGKRYFLAHSIGEHGKCEIDKYSYYDYIWERPDYSKCYDPDVILITGHTPTYFIDKEYKGRIYQGNNHIAIDCGAAYQDGRLGCICLDTMEEFYI